MFKKVESKKKHPVCERHLSELLFPFKTVGININIDGMYSMSCNSTMIVVEVTRPLDPTAGNLGFGFDLH